MDFKDFLYLITNGKVDLLDKKPLRNPKYTIKNIVDSLGVMMPVPPTIEEEKLGVVEVIKPIIETYKQKTERLFNTMTINENIVDANGKILLSNIPRRVDQRAKQIISYRERYQGISGRFANPIKWYHIGLIHLMEGELNFNTYLGNGQSIYKKTTIVPKGRGPFASFEAGAVDAITYDELDKIWDWSIGNSLVILEGFNGYGYRDFRGINSPYIWSGSNHYTKGKYVSDGASGYDKNYVSRQIGIALIYRRILELIGEKI